MNNGKTKFKNTALFMQEALFKLLDKNEFSQISVAKLCKTAGVNRSTFYEHYENTFDLLQEAIEYSIDKFAEEFAQLDLDETKTIQQDGNYLISTKYLVPYLEFIKKNQVMFRAYTNNAHIFSINKYENFLVKKVFVPVCNKNGIFDNTIIKYMSKYYLSGINAIVAEWVKNGCKDDILFIAEIIILCVNAK